MQTTPISEQPNLQQNTNKPHPTRSLNATTIQNGHSTPRRLVQKAAPAQYEDAVVADARVITVRERIDF